MKATLEHLLTNLVVQVVRYCAQHAIDGLDFSLINSCEERFQALEPLSLVLRLQIRHCFTKLRHATPCSRFFDWINEGGDLAVGTVFQVRKMPTLRPTATADDGDAGLLDIIGGHIDYH